ncbi:MAG: hypothetical protein D8M59_01980 [Planctomycetes bacterium]|nr:hypothetical protein [Planctomycetota bacterium]
MMFGLAAAAGLALVSSAQAQNLYLTSLDGTGYFASYDPGSDTWTTLTNYNTFCQFAAGSGGELYGYGNDSDMIQLYDPGSDTWSDVMPGPGIQQKGNLEVTADGEFIYHGVDSSTLYYTVGGVWNKLALDIPPNAIGDYDPATNRLAYAELRGYRMVVVDMNTLGTNVYSGESEGNGEWGRGGAIYGNECYYQWGSMEVRSFNMDTMVGPNSLGGGYGFYDSLASTPDGDLYVCSLSGSQLQRIEIATGIVTPLTGYGSVGNHSSIAYTGVSTPKFNLTVTGDCPGIMEACAHNANRGDKIVVIYGFAPGSAGPVPGCPGLYADIKNPVVAASGSADANGDFCASGKVPQGACGRVLVQAINRSTCEKSAVVNI